MFYCLQNILHNMEYHNYSLTDQNLKPLLNKRHSIKNSTENSYCLNLQLS